MTPAMHPEHGAEDLCAAGTTLYERALREGRVSGTDAEAAPCLIGLGLLRPALTDVNRLEPVAPAVVLHRLLRNAEDRILEERRRGERLAEAFEPLMHLDGHRAGADQVQAVSILCGTEQINSAITTAMAEAAQEALCIQPNTHYRDSRGETAQAVAMDRDQELLDRGCRIRTLYQHTQRHIPLVTARYERLRGDAQARTLDEVTDRLILIDRTVAFIPADGDGSLALEIRHPAIVGLGMNIRTAREHIAKLAATLGSESRAQLGYLIGESGILKQVGEAE